MQSSSKRKIIIIGPVYPYRGGNALFVSFLYESLSKEYDVKIFNYKLLYPSLLFPGKTQYDVSGEVKKIESERIINSISPFSWINTASRINKENPDLIIFDWWHPFFGFCHFGISQLLSRSLKSRILFITENFVSHEAHFIDKILTRIGFKNAKYFLTLSAKVAEELKPLAGERTIYRSELPIYDQYVKKDLSDLARIRNKYSFNEQDKILLFFGYVRKYKGLDLLIEALSQLKSSGKNYKLLVAGEFYDKESEYTNLIAKFNLDNDVKIFNEYIPNEKVYEFFSISDLVVLPYRSATQSGILNLAYGFKKPVVITNVGGLGEFVENEKTGIVVQSTDSKDISSGIEKFFKLVNDVNFEENISQLISSNRFNKIPSIINQIVSSINDH